MMFRFAYLLIAVAALCLTACGGGGGGTVPGGPTTPGSPTPPVTATPQGSSSPTPTPHVTPTPTPHVTPTPTATPTPTPTTPAGIIKHVVIIIQENRSFDNLFNGFPGADTASSGTMSSGQTVQLQPVGLEATGDIDHSHQNFLKEYANGNLFFDLGDSSNPTFPYSYVPQSETAPYWALASRFVLA
ncbi:MAG: hypothetical protein JO092_00320, partial [Candidatus Eremiobacteraeota bacterium]|nr:hypothetical protein [Candidatus Eremiobacteraeota bacterium]